MTIITVPGRAKPAKALGNGPTLQAGHVVEDEDGKPFLQVTDGFKAALFEVPDDTPLGPVHGGAVRELGRKRALRLTEGSAAALDGEESELGITFAAPHVSSPGLVKSRPADSPVTVSLNARYLRELADALGCTQVTLTLDVTDGTTLRALVVEPTHGDGSAKGLLMPVRLR